MQDQTRPVHIFHEAVVRARAGDFDGFVEALAAYEATGDHDHGRGPIPAGKLCPGGDCLVAEARALLQARTDLVVAAYSAGRAFREAEHFYDRDEELAAAERRVAHCAKDVAALLEKYGSELVLGALQCAAESCTGVASRRVARQAWDAAHEAITAAMQNVAIAEAHGSSVWLAFGAQVCAAQDEAIAAETTRVLRRAHVRAVIS